MDFVFIDECEHLPEWVWRQHGLQRPMSTEQPTKRRAGLLQRSRAVHPQRPTPSVREVPVIGVNFLKVNADTMNEFLTDYMNSRVFSSVHNSDVVVTGVKEDSDGFLIEFEPAEKEK